MMARTCTNNLRVVLSPYVQQCLCEATEQKWDQKTNILKQGDRAYFFISFDSSQRVSHFSVFVCQNWMKNGQVMAM